MLRDRQDPDWRQDLAPDQEAVTITRLELFFASRVSMSDEAIRPRLLRRVNGGGNNLRPNRVNPKTMHH